MTRAFSVTLDEPITIVKNKLALRAPYPVRSSGRNRKHVQENVTHSAVLNLAVRPGCPPNHMRLRRENYPSLANVEGGPRAAKATKLVDKASVIA